MFTDRTRLRNALLLALLVAALLVPLLGQPYYSKLVARVVIFALVAVSLDLLVGYAGLVSLGHAAYFCLGCYVAGTLPSIGVHSAFLVLPGAALAGALFGLLTGAISLRATGLYFIFITLAFAQMAYYVAGGIRPLGGLDGFALKVPTTLPGGYELNQPLVLVWVSTALLILTLWGAHRLVRSPFGMVLQAARDNQGKLAAIGLPAYPARLAIYTVSASVAGALYANLTEFVSPASMSIFVSAEFLFMVILGGVASLFGPMIGALVFVALEQILSGLTVHWIFWLGIILVLRVLLLRRGLYGFFQR
ncbi:branched-chain amino acid ABC transporter permease [Verminephrobacter eiseniae]|uniref:branched-chain amino acid ABC transporter permease n=1 Tax=Verminephrobacter eiseniae TaxID=364317 RepID=UPI0022389393|nr:branched-chain amino acid ABC transporter permease [Verminephrobacter eiseniae]MCW5230939.1 branched-chain amino acid ABC transporter permease [Verminephrobacter eiseniae]MCW5292672.1 branched-chain amino acid ABC transporter permease [Verminephrobacter eiseniae]MCW8187933.1 branched-chain amino acid ABC transporter permease [Verminephrobacter eiseniae]MCW8226191.1 branched-chain amino acid ABC transporter permease [Verminephrobacter eiseniae]MCW8236723.1 branched-chain amino acid ABC trans